jgi:hypothetical protein
VPTPTLLAVFAALRWRMVVNRLRGGWRRDAVERASRAAAWIVPLLALATVAGSAGALAAVAAGGGWMAAAGRLDPAVPAAVIRAVSIVLFGIVLLLALGPAHADVAGHRRLLLLPIPHRTLHLLDVAARLADPWIVAAVPALILLPLGLLAGGRPDSAVLALAGGASLALLFALSSALVSCLLGLLLRTRRAAEVFTLAFVLALSTFSLVPALVSDDVERWLRRSDASRLDIGGAIARVDASLPAWTRALPSELYGRSIWMSLTARPGAAIGGVALLAAEAAVLFAVSAALHRRLLVSAVVGGASRSASAVRHSGRKLPGLSPAASAVARAQARTALRSVRGRLIVLLPGPLLLFFATISRVAPDDAPGGTLLSTHGHVLLGAGLVFGLYAMLAFVANQFASDRAGLTLQLLAPIPDRDLVTGKLVGCGVVYSVLVLICLACAMLAAPGGSPLVWASVVLGAAATYLLLALAGAVLSALFPVASDLAKTGSGGNPHGLSLVVGTMLVVLFSAPPAWLILDAHHRAGRPDLALLHSGLWAAGAALVSIALIGPVARVVGPRRENLGLVAEGR